jgi:hypothetical protein
MKRRGQRGRGFSLLHTGEGNAMVLHVRVGEPHSGRSPTLVGHDSVYISESKPDKSD